MSQTNILYGIHKCFILQIYRYWNERNLIELTTFSATKLFRSVWFDDTLDLTARIEKAEALGDLYADMYQQNGHIVLLITAHALFAALSLKCRDAATAVRVTEKLLVVCTALTDAAKTNEVLAEFLMRTYRTTDLISWTVNDRKTSANPNHTRLRENVNYMALLDRFDK